MTINFLNCIVELTNQGEPMVYYDVLNAVLEQECELALHLSSEKYKEKLAEEFGSRKDPVSSEDLFELFAVARDIAIEDFSVNGQIRDKFE